MNDLWEQVLVRVRREADARPYPSSTYRLQLHSGFRFRDAAALVPYLHDLGITHCYASPYLKARPGSRHGYDITDHNQLNPEIGSEDEHTSWIETLHAHGMGLILDIVPNHMGIVGNENAWWNDVLENGQASTYAGFFDISWQSSLRSELHGKVLLPILGEPYGKVLESGQLRLEYVAGAFHICYFQHRFPASPRSGAIILDHGLEALKKVLSPEDPALAEYQSILTALQHLPLRTETQQERIVERNREKEVCKRRLNALTEQSAPIREEIERSVAAINGNPIDPQSFDLLDRLLDQQVYRLTFWRVASDEINYRRFFDINELAALSMERPEVFNATHALVLRLLAEDQVDGLRIDHPDGLFDPCQYLQRLQQQYLLARARRLCATVPEYAGIDWQEAEGPLQDRIRQEGQNASEARDSRWPLYVIVEKILGSGESLPDDWPTCGTSGYDFLNAINGLFVNTTNASAFNRIYRDWIQDYTRFADVVYEKKSLILRVALSGELHTLACQLDRLAQKNRWSRDFTLTSLRQALREVIACFPVYRSYISEEVHESDRRHVMKAVSRAMARNPAMSSAVFDFVRDMLLLQYPATTSEEDRAEQRRFVGKFQQLTAPVMAKGLEDTSFYFYNRLLSLNEVGGDPGRFGIAPAALNRNLQERQARWPYAFSTSSTHDTKRSEDVRARLNVLSELPDAWQECLVRWSQLNERFKGQVDEEGLAPDANEEYFLYQTLLGTWPLEPYGPDEYADFVQRIHDYIHKALHEAKVHTSWISPNPAYNAAVQQFVDRILDPQISAPFLEDFLGFQRRISHWGLFNSLSQTLLKITAPGVPDTYQGMEIWDFSLVDPDNRRPVDYERRRRMLRELDDQAAAIGSERAGWSRALTEAAGDGRIKLYVTSHALRSRRQHPDLFTRGEYVPLEVSGPRQDHVFAFLRRYDAQWAVVIIPRFLTQLIAGPSQLPMGRDIWLDTVLHLPDRCPTSTLVNVFTGEDMSLSAKDGQSGLPVASVLTHFPVGLLRSRD